MGKRVNIQYSVELEDLEEEVIRLYSAAIRQLASLPESSINLGTEGLDKVDCLRQKLAKVDIMLGDVQNIIEGYVRFKTKPPPEHESPQQQMSNDLKAEELQEQIAKFKEMFSAQPNQESEEPN